jgi:hypothetical protein
MRSLSSLLLSALCCFPFGSFAAPVYQLAHRPGEFFVTPEAACDAAIPDAQTPLFTILSSTPLSSSVCLFTVKKISDGSIYYNQGKPCSSAPTCALLTSNCNADATSTIQWPLGPRDTSFPSNVNPATATVPPFPVCAAGCKVAKVSVDSCYAINDQVPLFMHCDYNVKNTGEACSTADTPPKPDTSKCPAGTVLSGSNCVADPPPDPCIADPNAPGCTTPPDPCIANPTGPGCTTPPDPCIANPSGPGCPTDPGGGGTDPGGGGTKPGEGTGPGTGTQPEPGAAGGLACGDVFICSGDSIACATAQLQKIEMCNGVRNSDYNGKGREVVADILKDPKGDLQEGEIHLASIISGHARFLPSSCPPAQTFTVYGRQFAFKNDLFCNFAISMSWLVVAMASLTAALYIGQSFGSS